LRDALPEELALVVLAVFLHFGDEEEAILGDGEAREG
jgi:hypothetical protein